MVRVRSDVGYSDLPLEMLFRTIAKMMAWEKGSITKGSSII